MALNEQHSGKKPSWAGQGAILLCAVLWSTSGLFIKLVSWHPLVISGLRSFVAALFMLGVRFLFSSKKTMGREPPPNPRGPLFAGALAYALTMITFVIANKLTASANAIMLQYSAPVWAALLGWFIIGERPHWEHWAALALVAAGLLLFFRGSFGSGFFLGDIIAVLSGIAFGAHSVFMRMQKDASPADSMLLAHVMSFSISIPFIFLYPPEFTRGSVWAILFMGIIQIGCASLLFSHGIRHIRAVSAMLIAGIEPVLNPVWVLLATGEKPSASAFAGGGIIIAAVIASSLIGMRRK